MIKVWREQHKPGQQSNTHLCVTVCYKQRQQDQQVPAEVLQTPGAASTNLIYRLLNPA